MALDGKFYVLPNPQDRTWTLVVHNTGDKAFGVTQNILPPGQPDLEVHDDNGAYGHGMPVSPDKVTTLSFRRGDIYRKNGGDSVRIDAGVHLRVGLRGNANFVFDLPPLKGAPLEANLADFNWYNGSQADARPQNANQQGRNRFKADRADGGALVGQIQALMQAHQVDVRGQAKVVAVPNAQGATSHWEVWFENKAKTPCIGTCTFTRGEKNEGLGLESMALPEKGSRAKQRIERLGNYGVEADVGEKLRLGIRGFGWTQVRLPSEGEVAVPFSKFVRESSQFSEEFFDAKLVKEKQGEKRDKVQFFKGKKAINDELQPETHFGDRALALSTFDPPDLVVKRVNGAKKGWKVSLTSRLPEFDDEGRVGFVAAIKLDEANPLDAEAKRLGPRKLLEPGESKHWFVPEGEDLGGCEAKAGAQLLVSTRGLGWFAALELPAAGQIDSRKDDSIWGLREDQYSRRNLTSEYLERFRD